MTLDILKITINHGGRTITTGPEGFSIMALIPDVITALLIPLPHARSDISGRNGCVAYRDSDGRVTLTPNELMRLAGHRLHPEEFHALKTKYGIRHQWHDDFYDETTGEALQPRAPLP